MEYMFAFIVRYDIQLVLIWKLLLQFVYYVFFGKVLKMVTKLYIYKKKVDVPLWFCDGIHIFILHCSITVKSFMEFNTCAN